MPPEAARPPDLDAESRDEAIADDVSLLLESHGRRATPAQLVGYVRAMRGLSAERVGLAVQQALESPSNHPPQPGQLREWAIAGPGGYAVRAQRAWEEFDGAVSRFGGDRSVSFRDGLINASVRRCGGWVRCCERSADDYEVWLKKEFVEHYTRLMQSGCDAHERVGHHGRLRMANASYSDEQLRKLSGPNRSTGLAVSEVPTTQPLIAGPEPMPAIEGPRGGVAKLECKTP